MNIVLHSLHFLGNSHDAQFPLVNATNVNVRKTGKKSTEGVPNEKIQAAPVS